MGMAQRRWLPYLSFCIAWTTLANENMFPPPEQPLRIRAVRAESPIRIDGHLIEQDWVTAIPASGFLQIEPVPRGPATEDTEVRVLFDERYLYFGVRCHRRVWLSL